MRYSDHKSVSHAERAVAVAHAVGGPAFREALELVELVGNKAAVAAVDFYDMLEAGSARAALRSVSFAMGS